MDELQEQVAVVSLRTLAEYGFALAGGQSLQAYGFIERPSADIDMFTDRIDVAGFAAALTEVVTSLSHVGYTVEVARAEKTFARLDVAEPGSARHVVVEMAVDPREFPPAQLDIGPVLDVRDAVTNKVVTVFGRAYARDYIDLAAILQSGRYGRDELLQMAGEVDPGFDLRVFRQALEAVDRFDDDEFGVYDIDPAEIADVRQVMRAWAEELPSA